MTYNYADRVYRVSKNEYLCEGYVWQVLSIIPSPSHEQIRYTNNFYDTCIMRALSKTEGCGGEISYQSILALIRILDEEPNDNSISD